MAKRLKVVTLGEIMLRLSTPNHERFSQADQFDAVYGGGEANVAVSIANYGLDSVFVSKLPANPIGDAAVNHLRRFGVNTSEILRGGNRVGIYFLESGASMRPSKVVYDRVGSAIAETEADEFDFDSIFSGVDWFHFSGITPALSEKSAKMTEAALIAAKRNRVKVSVDLNYRKKLWTTDQAQKVMRNLMQYVDVCIGNEEDAEKTLGFVPGNTDITTGKVESKNYQEIFKEMQKTFGFEYVVTTLRESYSASDNGWSALIYDGHEFYQSKHYDIHIVDRVGGGDSFSGALIYGLLSEKCHEDALDFAIAASALKHTISGDFNLVTVDEVEHLMNGDASGRVQR